MNDRLHSYADMVAAPTHSQLSERRSSRSTLKQAKGSWGGGMSRKKKRLTEMRFEARKSELG